MAKKLTYEYVKKFIKENGCELLSQEYINSRAKLEIKCKCGNIFFTSFDQFKNQNKRQCDDCGMKNLKNKKKADYNKIIEFVTNNSKSTLITAEDEYINEKQKLHFKCECGTDFWVNFSDFKFSKIRVCKECGKVNYNLHKRIKYEVIKNTIENNNSGCKLITTEDEYINSMNKLKIRCKCGRIFETIYWSFKNQHKRQCDECISSKGEKEIINILKLNKVFYKIQKEFVGLIGINRGLLKFDFSIFKDKEKNNLTYLIEYDGEFHFFPIMGEKQFKKQKRTR